jgi:serine/threonine-protein kinase
MGEVWRAEHRMLARPAAIKIVMPQTLEASGTEAQTLYRRFEREARATARLSSLHTIEIYDFGRTDAGALYYVMELLDGTDLETMVQRHGPLSPARTVFLLEQVCESLAEAHESGLVHRDVKPANIYVCRLGTLYDRVKVLDFGLVAVRGALGDHATRLTAEGSVTGTPAYMAPEVATGEQDPDERVDIYALGCVAYWMLTGTLVFEGGNPIKMLYAHASKQPEPPSTRVGHAIATDLEQLVLQCLAKDPADRPGSVRALGRQIAACRVGTWTDADAEAWWRDRSGDAAGGRPSSEEVADTVVAGRRAQRP